MATKRPPKKGATNAAPSADQATLAADSQGIPRFSLEVRSEIEKCFERERENAPGQYSRSSAARFAKNIERIAQRFTFDVAHESVPLTLRQKRTRMNAVKAAIARAASHLQGLDMFERYSLINAMWEMDWKSGRERFDRLRIGPSQEEKFRGGYFSQDDAQAALDLVIDFLQQAAAAVPQASVVQVVRSAGYGPENQVAADITEIFRHYGLRPTASANGFAVRCYLAVADLAKVKVKPNTARSRMEWAVTEAETTAVRNSRPQEIVVSKVGSTE